MALEAAVRFEYRGRIESPGFSRVVILDGELTVQRQWQ